jgi:hypothetical protein
MFLFAGVEHRHEQRLFIGEVMVESAAGYAGLSREIPYTYLMVAPRCEEFAGGLDQRKPCGLRPLCPCGISTLRPTPRGVDYTCCLARYFT